MNRVEKNKEFSHTKPLRHKEVLEGELICSGVAIRTVAV